MVSWNEYLEKISLIKWIYDKPTYETHLESIEKGGV